MTCIWGDPPSPSFVSTPPADFSFILSHFEGLGAPLSGLLFRLCVLLLETCFHSLLVFFLTKAGPQVTWSHAPPLLQCLPVTQG